MERVAHDHNVDLVSTALSGRSLDVVVSGSIAATESVKFIRALRRLGASVRVWLTRGGAQFITPLSLEWACNRPVITDFSGRIAHTREGDGLIIAPASHDFVCKLAAGISDEPALALAASYFGSDGPVLGVANMHESLARNPIFKDSMRKLESSITWLPPRQEEGKLKFPAPHTLADQVSHHLNSKEKDPVFVTMGPTISPLDEFRYVANRSTGKLGTEVVHELFRQGIPVHVVAGPAQYLPTLYTAMSRVETPDQMKEEVERLTAAGIKRGVFAAAVLDFVNDQPKPGKVRSGTSWDIGLRPSTKVIGTAHGLQRKVGFKLEPSVTEARAKSISDRYAAKYELTMMVVNGKNEVTESEHSAYCYWFDEERKLSHGGRVESRHHIAQQIARHMVE